MTHLIAGKLMNNMQNMKFDMPDSPTGYGKKAGSEIMNMLKVSQEGNFDRGSSPEEPEVEQGPREARSEACLPLQQSPVAAAAMFHQDVASGMMGSFGPAGGKDMYLDYDPQEGSWFAPLTQFDFVPPAGMDFKGQNTFIGMAPMMQMPVAMALPQMQMMPDVEARGEWAEVYTVMLRNIPNKYSQSALCDEINNQGYAGLYDFLYLPIDMETNANKGYAFINFVEPRAAWAFKCQFDDRKLGRFNSSKVVKVVPATLQGLDANYAHYSSARVSRGDPKARPLFLRVPTRMQRDYATNPGHGRRGPQVAQRSSQPETPQQIQEEDSNVATACVRKFCPFCGAKIGSDFKFCVGCGNSLETTETFHM
mmetsp:Transcript_84370/g.149182  ORF Transcript_84370/g.149182 Transcript_84370/m.149182 type:complete len:366 (-) Transcript_84370:211-1308(-)|eukprot:CAMPEP_0197648942 /NCGR_PEP_ID=MMETSP1338-20131121/28048_1 /TAXON_ID=43686 ORGANISM="Pelagodinium beii, Strain RCC1491" /NCGR_SAMPLE_ID=MMETSP1338 /ASSEMBLY_ACC=CAM_ASM_000754 /LENGTH=365 /DNA_ID=CAMNT_0043223011 /DNA_START=43 /DNA_END=1140 /DNA_ORIENTATION=-